MWRRPRTTALRRSLERADRELYPGYFALVMATGIVSIAAHLHGLVALAWALFYVNVAAYALLGALTLARVIRYFPLVASEVILTDGS